MTLKEQIVAILQERSFEVRDGATKMQIVDSTDFEVVALDIVELLAKDYGVEAE
jgi:hypothetical protein